MSSSDCPIASREAAALVGRVFGSLATAYGREFAAAFEGVDPGSVRTAWARGLAPFVDRPAAVDHALENLPARRQPPSLPEFTGLCRAYRGDEERATALPAPKDPAGLRRLAATLGGLRRPPPTAAERAAELRRRLAVGERLSPAQRDWLRRVERSPAGVVAEPVTLAAISADVLPPGMRPADVSADRAMVPPSADRMAGGTWVAGMAAASAVGAAA
jgi:hypothetical protein